MEQYLIKQPEDWVEMTEINEKDFQIKEDSPYYYYLVDYQELVTDSKICRYKRTIEHINDASRIEDASLILTELREENHQIIFHSIEIIREGQRFNALNENIISLTQRERSLENHITDNKLTVSLSIDDLRVGDIIDYQETEIIYAAEHPFFGKYYYSLFWLNWMCPVQTQRIRIVNQSQKNIVIQHATLDYGACRSQNVVVESGDNIQKEYDDLTAMPIENSAPNWLWVNHLIAATEESWQNLSHYLYRYYQQQAVHDDDIDVESLIEISGNTAKDIIKAVRFVQNDIRYKGENHGIFSHTPKQPKEIMQRRSGDCKDKSNLLVALLTKLGVKARLALVNTDYGIKVKQMPISPFHFNHMIVYVEFLGKEYFFDPTIKKQAGNIHNCTQLDYGYSLILEEGGKDLVKLPYHLNRKIFALKHVFDFSEQVHTLTIQRHFFAHRADNTRYYFDSVEKTRLTRDYLKYARDETDLDLEIVQAIRIVDDNYEENTLRTEEIYRIQNIDKTIEKGEQLHLATTLYQELPEANSSSHLIGMALEGEISHDIEVVYPTHPSQGGDEKVIKNKWFYYADSVYTKGNTLFLSAYIQPKKRLVAADEVDEYSQDSKDVWSRSMNNFSYTLSETDSGPELSRELISGILLVLAVLVLVLRRVL